MPTNSITSVEYREIARLPRYRFGNDGSVWSCRKTVGAGKGKGGRTATGPWRQLTVRSKANGYLVVDIQGRTYYLHRLILEAFAGDCPPGMECLHANGNRNDNRPCNLSWGTRSENHMDKHRHGTMPKGEGHFNARLTDKVVHRVRELASTGIPQFKIAEMMGLSRQAVNRLVRRTRWQHLS